MPLGVGEKICAASAVRSVVSEHPPHGEACMPVTPRAADVDRPGPRMALRHSVAKLRRLARAVPDCASILGLVREPGDSGGNRQTVEGML